MKSLISIAITFTILLLQGCFCGPDPINSFTVDHQLVCPGETVTVTWDVSTSFSEIQVLSGGTLQRTVPINQGTHNTTFVVQTNTTFTLRASRSGLFCPAATRSVDVHVFRDNSNINVNAPPFCNPSSHMIEGDGSARAFLADPFNRMVIRGVTLISPTNREVTVSDGSHPPANLRSGQSTNNFNGDPAGASWHFIASSMVGECLNNGTSASRYPPTFVIQLAIGCPDSQNLPSNSNTNNNSSSTGTGLTCGGNPINSSTQPFSVGISLRAAYCDGIETYIANSAEEAQQCARNQFPGATIVFPVTQEPQPFIVAVALPISGCIPVTYTAFNEENALECARRDYPSATSVRIGSTCPSD